MSGVNKVILLGNLGKDPEVRQLQSGSKVVNLALATSEAYKDKGGNKVENTEWHELELWDGLAGVAEQYLKKGDTIYVEGKIKSNTWQDDQGNNRKQTRIRVLTLNIVKTGRQPAQTQPRQTAQPANQGVIDDTPF